MQKGINASVAVGIIAVIVIVLGGLFLSIGKKNIEENATVPQNQSKVETTPQAAQAPMEKQKDTITYENKEYGFSLELPKSWSDYKVKVTKVDTNLSTLEFLFSTNNADGSGKQGEKSLLAINAESLSSWNQYPDCKTNYQKAAIAHGCPKTELEIGRNNKLVFTAVGPQWIPTDLEGKSNTLYGSIQSKENSLQYVEALKKSFKVLSDSQSAVNTSDCKTYKNDQYGFEFQYPKDLKIDTNEDQLKGLSKELADVNLLDIHLTALNDKELENPKRICDEGKFSTMEIQIGLSKNGKDLREFIQSEMDKTTQGDRGITSSEIKQTVFGENVGFEVAHSGWESVCDGPGYYFNQKNSTKFAHVFTEQGASKNETVKNILSSFKFTK